MKARWKVSRVLLLAIIFAFLLAASIEVAPASAAAFTNCATVGIPVPDDECQALVDLYDSTNGASWSGNNDWKVTDDVCSWYGIYCDAGGDNVKEIYLWFNNLDGAFAGDFSTFTSLETFHLSGNTISGDMTTILGVLPAANLKTLGLANLGLPGTIPASFSSFTSLEEFYADRNQLTGAVDVILGYMPTSLKRLVLGQNSFTAGPIPASIASLTALELFSMEVAGLNGDFGTNVGYFSPTLKELYFRGNLFTGTIPLSMASLTNLTHLDLSSNIFMTGDLSLLFGYFPTSLENLVLFDMNFTGTIPLSAQNFTRLEYLNLAYNQLTGPLATALSNLPVSILSLQMSGNSFTGTIPASLAALANLEYLDVGQNSLTGDLTTALGYMPLTIKSIGLDYNGFTGSIPASIQNFNGLESLRIQENPGLSGTIPVQITNLSLYNFNFYNTDLCEPDTPTYEAWKNTVSYYVVGNCLLPFNGGVEITAGGPIVAIARPHIGSEIMAYNGANEGATTVYLPMLFNDKWNYTSTFTIQNADSGTNTFSLIFKDATDGSTTCTILGESLPVHGVKTYDVSALPGCDGGGNLPTDWFGGAAVVSTSSDLLVAVAKVNVDGSDAVAYNGFTSGADSAYLPMLFRGKWGYQAAFYVQNLDPAEDADVTVKFYDSTGLFTCTYTLPTPIQPFATQGIWMAGLTNVACDPGIDGTGFDPAGWAGNAVIETGVTGSQSIVAIGRPHMGTEVAAYNGFSSGSTINYLPMLFRGQWGYTSAVYIQNLEGTASDVMIEFFDTDGNYTCTYFGAADVDGYATIGYWIPSLTCTSGSFPAQWAGSAKITTSEDTVVVGRPHLSDNQVVAYNGIPTGNGSIYLPMLFRQYSGSESAVYVQNLDTVGRTVTLTFYDEDTDLYCTYYQTVNPNASTAIWLASVDGAQCTP